MWISTKFQLPVPRRLCRPVGKVLVIELLLMLDSVLTDSVHVFRYPVLALRYDELSCTLFSKHRYLLLSEY